MSIEFSVYIKIVIKLKRGGGWRVVPKSKKGNRSQPQLRSASLREIDQLRLSAKVAWLYHIRNMSQGEIAKKFGLSQSGVSRLLEQAKSNGIVRTEITLPVGLFTELESGLEEAYGMREAHVFDVPEWRQESQLVHDLGKLLAIRLATSGIQANVIGFTSWSRSLSSTVESLKNLKDSHANYVVEMLGDVGNPAAQHEAALVTQQLAEIVDAQPIFLRVPGVVANKAVRDNLVKSDFHLQDALQFLDRVELALVGIGTCNIIFPLTEGDNFFTAKEFEIATNSGAVGQVNLRFIDKDGNPVKTELDDRVIGISLNQLKKASVRIGVAGGPSKNHVIRAALRGGWINTLATDVDTAKWLLVNAHQ
jgi:DNA-binding transcriptional regulator LsrR (DeoR family)